MTDCTHSLTNHIRMEDEVYVWCVCVCLFTCVGLAPPSSVRAGKVTVSSIELQWDPAPGHGHTYEVICLDCHHTFKVSCGQ